MATSTFQWRVQASPSNQRAFTTRDIQFGDGYIQSLGEGMNAVVQSYSISWTGSYTDCLAIMTFLDNLGGYKSFFWTDPMGNLGLFRCKDHSPVDIGEDLYQITGTFERRYSA